MVIKYVVIPFRRSGGDSLVPVLASQVLLQNSASQVKEASDWPYEDLKVSPPNAASLFLMFRQNSVINLAMCLAKYVWRKFNYMIFAWGYGASLCSLLGVGCAHIMLTSVFSHSTFSPLFFPAWRNSLFEPSALVLSNFV